MNYRNILLATIILLSMSCEEVINVDLENASPILVVDAWITSEPENQVILLSTTSSYFSESLQPTVEGASITVTDEFGVDYEFIETENGKYEWSPTVAQPFIDGAAGTVYNLNIAVNGQTYISSTTIGRVPQIDSLSLEEQPLNTFVSPEIYYLAQFWATDLVGSGDAYWIKSNKNGVPLNKPSEISLAFDSGFTQGGNFDGVTFIQPIRQSINPFDTDSNDNFLSPYLPGDSVYVEIHSISEKAFQFLNEVKVATDRPGGFAELFAQPLSNVPTNIKNTNTAIEGDVIGYFNVAAVSGLGKRFE